MDDILNERDVAESRLPVGAGGLDDVTSRSGSARDAVGNIVGPDEPCRARNPAVVGRSVLTARSAAEPAELVMCPLDGGIPVGFEQIGI